MFPGFRPVNWSNAYEAAAWCVISSRISMRQAQGVKDRMSRELGHAIDVHGHVLWTFLGPDRLAHLERFPGLFGRKVEYLNALGRAALAGEVDTERLRAMPREESLKSLQRLPGIGPFGSELVRLRGELLLHTDARAEAEGVLRQSLELARARQGRWFELRAATSLARVLHERDDRAGAHGLLSGVYAAFREGFETLDLRLARALLATLM